jgi:hypothetical protein
LPDNAKHRITFASGVVRVPVVDLLDRTIDGAGIQPRNESEKTEWTM